MLNVDKKKKMYIFNLSTCTPAADCCKNRDTAVYRRVRHSRSGLKRKEINRSFRCHCENKRGGWSFCVVYLYILRNMNERIVINLFRNLQHQWPAKSLLKRSTPSPREVH